MSSDNNYAPELDRKKYQIRSYLEKKRNSWYESLGPAKEDIFKHHTNVNLLQEYENEQRIREREKVLVEKKRQLIENETILQSLISRDSEDATVQLIKETELKKCQREKDENDLSSFRDAKNMLQRSLTSQRLVLEKVLNCKRFLESIVKDEDQQLFEIDFRKLFLDYEERLKCSLLEITLKTMEIQKVSKERWLTVEHWHGDIEDLKKRHYYLSSQISRERERVEWLKQTLANIRLENESVELFKEEMSSATFS